MSTFQKVMKFLKSPMQTPQAYGWFHLMFLGITILITVLLCLLCRKGTDKQVKIVLLASSIFMIVFDFYKQLVFSYNVDTNTWHYAWSCFPFHLCSTTMYVGLIASLCKKSKLQDALLTYIAVFGLIGALATLLYPGFVFSGVIGVNIQTMLHHGIMIAISIWLFTSGRIKFEKHSFIGASIIFVVVSLIALLLNIFLYQTSVAQGYIFNMFFNSPYFTSQIPVVGNLPYPIFLFIYYILFITLGLGIYMFAKLMNKITKRKHNQ